MLPAHLHRARSGILHFRIAIPADVQHHFQIREIYRSLRTANVHDAALAAQALTCGVKCLFLHLRTRTMSIPNKPPLDPLEGFEMGLMWELPIPGFGVAKVRSEETDTPEQIAVAITSTLNFAAAMADGSAGAGSPSAAPARESQVISAYVESYFDNLPAEQRPNRKSLEQYRASFQTFIKIVGDKALLQLERKDANRFEDVIKKLPANSTKLTNTREISTDEVVALGLPPMSLTNAKNVSRRINKFLRFAFRREGVDAPFQLLDEVKVVKRTKGEKKRRGITDDELRLIFNSETLAVGQQSKPYMF
jgi:hypothetical protein